MNPRNDETQLESPTFDFSAYPADTLFLDRRTLPGPNGLPPRTGPAPTPKPRKERRRRVDPTTFEKQYSEEEIAFMNAIQTFKSRSGKMFPSHGDILRVALQLGYRKLAVDDPDVDVEDDSTAEVALAAPV